jgi:hypothetical protein
MPLCAPFLTQRIRKAVPAARQGHAADGALRPQDRRDFETWKQPDCLGILLFVAGL